MTIIFVITWAAAMAISLWVLIDAIRDIKQDTL